MDYENITTGDQLRSYCGELAGCKSIALDTEFVSEHTYRPILCLVQVFAGGRTALIDAMSIEDMTPFWEVIAGPGHETLFHAGRSEMEFCWDATGRLPDRVIDVQLAAGLVGSEYPAGFSTLIEKLLGEKPQKHETRTDWRRRPLSRRQIQYALDDARFLPPIYEELHVRLERLGRLQWLRDEMTEWLETIELARSKEQWRRVSGNAGLNSRSLAVLRELWRWREAEAARRNCPVRRVLRDDLIVELAKRRSSEQKRISALRGMDRGDLKRRIHEIAQAIDRGLELPEGECPRSIRSKSRPKHSVLGQLFFAASGSICRREEIASSLVGTPNDIREWIAYRLGESDLQQKKKPRLARGWRAEFLGKLFEDLLAGRTALRVVDPSSDHPLVIEPLAGDTCSDS